MVSVKPFSAGTCTLLRTKLPTTAMAATVMQASRMAFMARPLPPDCCVQLITNRTAGEMRRYILDRGCHLLRPRPALRRIDVEEGVDRLVRPVGGRGARAGAAE